LLILTPNYLKIMLIWLIFEIIWGLRNFRGNLYQSQSQKPRTNVMQLYLIFIYRYKHFDWLAARMKEQFPISLLPRLPEKQQNGRFDENFVNRRKTLLNKWVKEVCRHPIVCNSKLITSFITIKDTEQKEWKNFKRSMEKTPYQHAGFFQAIDVPSNSPFLKDWVRQT